MSPITRSIYNHLRKHVEKDVVKHGLDSVHSRAVPVLFEYAVELGLDVEVSRKKRDKVKRKDQSALVYVMVCNFDYINAIEKYGQDRWGIEPFDFDSQEDCEDDDDIEVDLDDDDDNYKPETTEETGE